MARKPGKKFSSTSEPAPKKAPVLPKAIRDEPDPEWKQWFTRIEERRRADSAPKFKPYCIPRVGEDGESDQAVIWRKASPQPINALIKVEKKKLGQNLAMDLLLIEEAWKSVVDAETASETGIYSFKRGVLTITVESSSLFQEIRQFHKNAIERDLRDIWPASTPLVKISYRLGKIDDRNR